MDLTAWEEDMRYVLSCELDKAAAEAKAALRQATMTANRSLGQRARHIFNGNAGYTASHDTPDNKGR